MQDLENIIKSYDATAENYAATRIDELSAKPLNRILLREFAVLNQTNGKCADFGCGPGHVTGFLSGCGMKDITGVDISTEMVKTARKYFPGIRFEVGNLLGLIQLSSITASAVMFGQRKYKSSKAGAF
jgi:trans-aconitate methyltransferase